MGYFQGFVIPVKHGNKAAYRDVAAKAAPFFTENGATRIVECWEDDVPDGKLTDFKGAVQKKDGETVIFAWVEWPDKTVRDAGWAGLMQDARMQSSPGVWNGPLMIFGGFVPIFDTEG